MLVGKTYKYYLTEFGRHVALAGLTLKNLFLIPEFAAAAPAHYPEILAFLQSIVRRTDYPASKMAVARSGFAALASG